MAVISSVSGRGIRTPGVTSILWPQKVVYPMMYCNGSPAAARAAAATMRLAVSDPAGRSPKASWAALPMPVYSPMMAAVIASASA